MSVKVSTTLSSEDYTALVRVADKFSQTVATVVRAGVQIITSENGEAEFMFAPDETPDRENRDHGPDWSDWGIDHPEESPSCKCGHNGTPEECATDREIRVYEHGDPALYCVACDHYHAADVDCSGVDGSGVGYVIDSGSCPSPERENGSRND